MRYVVCADIHSFYDKWMDALKAVSFDKEKDTLVVLGDLLDRGPKPLQCLQFVNSCPNKILIRGNHEDLLEECLERKQFGMHDYHNGTAETVCILGDYNGNESPELFEKAASHAELTTYLSQLVDYYEDETSVFVHGWIPCLTIMRGATYNYFSLGNWQEGDWSKARWINGMDAWKQGVRVSGKTVYCGHWHTSWGHSHLHGDGVEFENPRFLNQTNYGPFIDDGIVALDACTVVSRKVNCFVIERG